VPFIVFNIVCFGFEFVMHSIFPSAFTSFSLLPRTPLKLLQTVFGLDAAPINAPLYFIRDMLVIIALVPLLGRILRVAPWLGLAALAIVCGTNADGNLLLRSSSLLLFYIGGAAAVYKWNIFALDKYAGACLIIFAAICVLIIGMGIDDNTFLVVAAPFLIWPSASLLHNTRVESIALKLSKYSFFIFVSHMPLLGASWWAVTHSARWLPYPIYWFAAPIMVVILLKHVYDLAMKVSPHLFNIAIGCRADKPMPADRRRAPRPVNAPIYSAELRGTLISS